MSRILTNALLALLALPLSEAAGPGYVHLPVQVDKKPQIDRMMMMIKRATDKTSAVDLTNLQSGYTINLTIAGQQTSVILDTGSTELWVNPDCSDASRADNEPNSDGSQTVDSNATSPQYCESIGRYDPGASSTSRELNEGTTFTYADNTFVSASYYTDNIDIGGLTIKGQQFAVANASNATALGIMGLGPDSLDGYNMSKPYSLILDSMASQGLINSRAFSLDLRDFDNATGSVIFGGLDKGKFSDSLQTLPLQSVNLKGLDQDDNPVNYDVFGYYVTVNSIGLTSPNNTSSTKLPLESFVAVLDSGTSALLLPAGLSTVVCMNLGGNLQFAGSTAICLVDCGLRAKAGSLDFTFLDKTIGVAYENLISQLDYQGQSYCYMEAYDTTVASDPPTYILGAPFLRSAYAVFDWDNQQVHLGQAADCGSNIVAITNGTDRALNDGGCSSSSSASVRSVARNSALMFAAALLTAAILL